ncbi:hypothetical protein ACFX2F_035661 [Malus domestica]
MAIASAAFTLGAMIACLVVATKDPSASRRTMPTKPALVDADQLASTLIFVYCRGRVAHLATGEATVRRTEGSGFLPTASEKAQAELDIAHRI